MSKFNSTENKWKRIYVSGKNQEENKLRIYDRIKHFKQEEPFVRPKAKYDNKSREDRINELIGYEGTGQD